MNHLERFTKTINFEKTDRLPNVEWAFWWDKTIDRWVEEGFDAKYRDEAYNPSNYNACAIQEALGLDPLKQYWFPTLTPDAPPAKTHGAPLLSSMDEYVKLRDSKAILPEDAFDAEDVKRWAKRVEKGEAVVWFSFEGFFWFPRTLLGIENHLMGFYDHPELMHQMNQDLVDYNLRQLDKLCEIVQPTFMTIAEDMSYNHGPMLSKATFDEFLAPYYKQVVPAIKAKGIKVLVDSDGDVNPLIPWLKEVGVEGILPLERMAGIDVNQIREDHPDFIMIGGFDKTVMHLGEEAIRAEFERVMPAMKSGGYIVSVDHQTPPGVSYEDYKMYLKLLREYSIKAVK